MRAAAGHANAGELADIQSAAVCYPDQPVDLRRIRSGSCARARSVDLVDQYGERSADFPGEAATADLCLSRHESRATLLPYSLLDGTGQRIRRRAVDRRIGEAADAVQL